MKNLLLIIAFAFSNSIFALNCSSIADGNWNNPSTWSCGVVPSAGDSITISVGTTVTVSVNTDLTGAPVTIFIDGILLFDSPGAKLRLECGSVLILSATGEIRDSGNGTPSHSIRICGADVWKGTDGSVFGPLIIIGSPLSVELLDFNVEMKRDLLLFSWITATETNNDYFSIEASSDQASWMTIGNVNGAGNSSEEITYSYEEALNGRDLIYFRIRQTDYDGRSTVSKIIVLKNNLTLDFNVFPNPLIGNKLTVETDLNKSYNLKITNSSGRVMHELMYINSSSITLSDLELNEGVYFISIENEGEIKTLKLIKN